MASKRSLRTLQGSGFLAGFCNLLSKEGGEWWGTRRGLLHLLLWTTLIGGSVLVKLLRHAEADNMVYTYTLVTGLLTSLGLLVVMQDAIVGEREAGTASWLLSKPVSRAAFLLSKLAANGMSLILVMIVAQGVLAFAAVSVAGGSPRVGDWIVGMALLALNLTFYLSLTLMLGTIFTGRGPIVGLPIGTLLAAFCLLRVVPETAQIMPWAIVFQPLATEAMLGRSPAILLPVLATILWCILFVATAIWRFQKEEF